MATWLITGCSSGIGAGIARAVLENGENAVVTARNVNRVEAAQQRFGMVDVLVSNAGHGYRSAIEEGEDEAVEEFLFGPIQLIKAVLPSMRQARHGAIINVSSIAAVGSGLCSGYYASSKAALELMTDGLAQELTPLGIKVMIVEPGSFRTRFYDESLQGTTSKIQEYDAIVGQKRKENIINLHNQPGNPDAAGRIIVKTIARDNYPLRLILGSDATAFIKTQLRQRMDELEQWETISRQSDY